MLKEAVQITALDYSLTELSDGPHPDSKPWDTSDPFISASTRIIMQRVMTCYIRQPITFVGVLGNILCCAVFLKQGLSDRINLLLFWLAVADLTSLVAQLLRMPQCYLEDPLQVANWSVIVYAKIAFINWWLTFVAGMLMGLLSVDRCLSVTVPFKVKRYLKYRVTVTAILVSYLLPFMFGLPNFLALTVRWRMDPSTNRSVAYTDTTPWFPMDKHLAIAVMSRFNLISKPVVLVVMIICCTITIFHLRKASRTREKMGGNVTEEGKSGDNRITIVLLVICCAYMIFAIPEIGAAIAESIVPEYYVFGKYHSSRIIHFQFVWIASCLNSAINFFPYLLLSSRFQRTVQEMFCIVNKHLLM